jgi:hypothetical protein
MARRVLKIITATAPSTGFELWFETDDECSSRWINDPRTVYELLESIEKYYEEEANADSTK